MTTKEELHKLIDQLPNEELLPAARYLAYLRDMGEDPVARSPAMAPYEEEDPPPGENEAAEEGRQAYLRGEYRSLEEVKRDLGIP